MNILVAEYVTNIILKFKITNDCVLTLALVEDGVDAYKAYKYLFEVANKSNEILRKLGKIPFRFDFSN